MNRALPFLIGLCISPSLWGQSPLSALDSLFWLPLPLDSLVTDHGCFVRHRSPAHPTTLVGALRWNPAGWAWQPDTAAEAWVLHIGSEEAVQQIDLATHRGLTQHVQVKPVGAPWEATREEGVHGGMRFRAFGRRGDTLSVVSERDVPDASAAMIAEWHAVAHAGWPSLAPLPGRALPVAYASGSGGHWSMEECGPSVEVIDLRDVLVFDPARTLMDVVREQKERPGADHR